MSAEPDDLKPFTRALAGVPLTPGQFDRDALLFAAGRAAGRRGAFWPATAAALALLSGTLAATQVLRPPALVVVERVHVPAPVAPDVRAPQPVPPPDDVPTLPETPPPDLVAGLRLRQRVLRDGVPALPNAPWASESPAPEVPQLSSLRLNATHLDGERFR